MQEALTKRGAECTIAKSGEQALKMFKRSKHEKFQYILMDADMPDMDGYQAARRIRLMDHPQAKTIPILAMTYHATPEAMRMAAITGMSGQVEKPVKMQTLALIITKLKSKNRFIQDMIMTENSKKPKKQYLYFLLKCNEKTIIYIFY